MNEHDSSGAPLNGSRLKLIFNDLVSRRVRYEKIEVMQRTVRVYGDVAIVLAREKYSILAGR